MGESLTFARLGNRPGALTPYYDPTIRALYIAGKVFEFF